MHLHNIRDFFAGSLFPTKRICSIHLHTIFFFHLNIRVYIVPELLFPSDFLASPALIISMNYHIRDSFTSNAKFSWQYWIEKNRILKRLRWSRGSVLAFGTQVRGFKPGRSRRIFQGGKILSTPSFEREVKPFAPCRRFTACKRSLNVTWKSGIFRQNSSAISRPSSSSFHY